MNTEPADGSPMFTFQDETKGDVLKDEIGGSFEFDGFDNDNSDSPKNKDNDLGEFMHSRQQSVASVYSLA